MPRPSTTSCRCWISREPHPGQVSARDPGHADASHRAGDGAAPWPGMSRHARAAPSCRGWMERPRPPPAGWCGVTAEPGGMFLSMTFAHDRASVLRCRRTGLRSDLRAQHVSRTLATVPTRRPVSPRLHVGAVHARARRSRHEPGPSLPRRHEYEIAKRPGGLGRSRQ